MRSAGFAILTATGLCLATNGASFAADLQVKAPVRAPVTPTIYNWNGFYVGVHVGEALGLFRNSPPAFGPIDWSSDLMGGGQVGYNWQLTQYVVGLEADVSALHIWATGPGVTYTEDWMATFRGRVGVPVDRFLFYLTAGAALTHRSLSFAPFATQTATPVGVTAGGGVEAFLPWGNNFTGRIEYLFVDVPVNTFTLAPGVLFASGSYNHIGRVALNYKF